MRLRQLFEATEKRAAFAVGRMNPATIGHELLVNEIKAAQGDSFLFLTDRAPKLPDNPLTAEEKLDWARKSFNGISIGLAKTVLTAADRLYKMGYTHVTFLEGEDKLYKLLLQYNGVEKQMHNYNFTKIDYVRLERDAEAVDAKGMSGTKLRSHVTNNDLESFKKGVTDNAQPYAEEMFKKLQGILGVDPVGESITENISVADFPNTAEDILSAYDLKFSPKDKTSLDRAHRVLKSRKDLRLKAYELYDKLGQGFGSKAYDAISNVIQQKKAQLRNIANQEIKRQGLTGADALHSETSQKRIQADNLLDSILAHAMAIGSLASATMRGNNARLKSDPQYKEYDFDILVPRDRELLAQSPYGQKNKVESVNVTEQAAPEKIEPLKMPTPPKAPDATIPRRRSGYTTDAGVTYKQDKYNENIMTVSNNDGVYTFDEARLIKWETPFLNGYGQIHDFIRKTITVKADTIVDTGDGEAVVNTDAVYDLKGNLKDAGNTKISSGGFSVGTGTRGTEIRYSMGSLEIRLKHNPRKVKGTNEKDFKALASKLGKLFKGKDIAKAASTASKYADVKLLWNGRAKHPREIQTLMQKQDEKR